MPAAIRLIAGAVFGFAALSALPSTAPAQELPAAPTYSRVRTGADEWHARGGGYGHAHGGDGYGYGYFQPYAAPIVTGSWYARPYPYHFDYYRHRWGGDMPAPATADCRCAETANTE
jgi:hypothetical protein